MEMTILSHNFLPLSFLLKACRNAQGAMLMGLINKKTDVLAAWKHMRASIFNKNSGKISTLQQELHLWYYQT